MHHLEHPWPASSVSPIEFCLCVLAESDQGPQLEQTQLLVEMRGAVRESVLARDGSGTSTD
jgi:hypothetical protein